MSSKRRALRLVIGKSHVPKRTMNGGLLVTEKATMFNDPNLTNPNIPINEQLYAIVRDEILDGLWVGRDDFPGEAELATRFNVSVITSRRVLTRLFADNLIDRGRGRRTKATYVPTRSRQSAPVMFPLVSQPFTYKVISAGLGTGPAEACDAFGIPNGSQLWLLKRLRSFEKRPHSVSYNAQLPELGRLYKPRDLGRLPMKQLLENAGKRPRRLIRRCGVALPSIDVATHLRIALHDPTLTYTFTVLEKSGAALEWVRIYVHPQEPSPPEVIDAETGELILQLP